MFSACGVGVEPRTPQNLIRIGLVGFRFLILDGEEASVNWIGGSLALPSETADSVRVLDFEPFVVHADHHEVVANLHEGLLNASGDEAIAADSVLVAAGSAGVGQAQLLALFPVAAILA